MAKTTNIVPEGWTLREAESLYDRLRTPRVYDRNQVNQSGKYPIIDQSESGCIGYLDEIPDFDCSQDMPLTTFANHTCAVRQMKRPFGVIQNVFPLKAKPDVSQHFLYQIINRAIPQNGYKGHYPELRETQFLTPPLPEQQKIATILTSVDTVIEKTRAQIDKLKHLKTGMMQELLTQGIGHTEFKDSPVGRIPKSWEVKEISHVCTDIVDCVNKTAPVVDYPTPYRMIRTTNVRNGAIIMDGMRYVTEATFQNWSKRITLQDGDIIFTREAPVGECGLLSASKGLFLGQRTMLYRADGSKINNLFLLATMQSEYFKSQIDDLSGGSTTPHLRVPDCSKILLKIPPIEEQEKIANMLQSIDTKIMTANQKLASLEKTKKAMMQDLLTGKVRTK